LSTQLTGLAFQRNGFVDCFSDIRSRHGAPDD
jgi:hypothetical protein